MTTTIAIIGASYLQLPLVEKAKELGLQTICFAWADGAVCADVADKFHPISIIEKEKILDVCKKENIDGVCTIASDVAAPTVAYVANKLGLIGNDYCAAVRANHKSLMRDAFANAGVPCPWFKKVQSFSDIKEEKLSYPLIVKPTDRSGSLGVMKVDNEEQLKEAIDNSISASFSKSAIIEQYVDGREISVEFISYQGKHFPLTITDKVTTGAPHFVELEHHQPSTLSDDVKNKIYEITELALNSLGITNGASHTEYRITDSGEIYIIELGGRMGGDFIGSDLVRLSTGYDFVRGVIDVALGNFQEPQFTISKNSGVYFLSKETKYVLPYIKNSKNYAQIVKAEITDETIRNITCSADRSGYFIYQADAKFTINKQ